MKANSFIILLFTFFSTHIFAQDMQWATEVVEYSSQYAEYQYSANQILGEPNSMNTDADGTLAWSPKGASSIRGEYITVRFNNPVYAEQLAIAESLNPGSIYRIFLYDSDGYPHQVYENLFPKKLAVKQRLFSHTFPKTDYLVTGLKLVLKTSAIKGINQIDAIGLSSNAMPIGHLGSSTLIAKQTTAPAIPISDDPELEAMRKKFSTHSGNVSKSPALSKKERRRLKNTPPKTNIPQPKKKMYSKTRSTNLEAPNKMLAIETSATDNAEKLTLRQELEAEVRAELKAELEEEIREELRVELRPIVADELRAEMSNAAPSKMLDIAPAGFSMPLKLNSTKVLSKVEFNKNSDKLTASSLKELDDLAVFLQKNPNIILEIACHTSDDYTDKKAFQLTTNQAKAIVAYLGKRKVENYRLQYRGYGKTKASPLGYTERVEIKITEIFAKK